MEAGAPLFCNQDGVGVCLKLSEHGPSWLPTCTYVPTTASSHCSLLVLVTPVTSHPGPPGSPRPRRQQTLGPESTVPGCLCRGPLGAPASLVPALPTGVGGE